ncbi:MAG: hypothetical protein FIA97_15080 [Methylococcaceae bacterium]|nr:hypothetical protein [Methylococcaceae bacterium]
MKRKALVVLENPWSTNDEFSHECSVKPFLSGLRGLENSFDLLYATFFDIGSFQKALELFVDGKYEKYILYVAAHGYYDSVASIKDNKLLYRGITPVAEKYNLEGVLFGSCMFGAETAKFETLLESSHLRWAIAYKYSIDWFFGTLIDIAILKKMLNLRRHESKNRDNITDKVQSALALFNKEALIGCQENEDTYSKPLKEMMTLVIQPAGSGNRPRDDSSKLF